MASPTSWLRLPDVALIQVYSYLSDFDRLNMACACKQWSRFLNTSILWRERRVFFKGLLSEAIAERECKFIRKHGQHLVKLIIGFSAPTFRSCKIISKAADQFLSMIASRREIHLRELDIEHLHMEQHWHYVLSRNRVVTALCKMLRKQRFLETVYASGARMTLFDGCRILEALGKGCASSTLKTLFIEDIFETNVFPYRNRRYIAAMSRFLALKNLHINYKYLNGEVLDIMGQKLFRTLSDLSMILEGDVRGVEIASESWMALAERCPKLKVGAYLCTTIFRGPLTSPFVQGIPLTEVYVTSWSRINDNEDRLPAFLRHIGATYHRSLASLALYFERHEPFDAELLYLLGRCSRLRDVSVSGRLSADTILEICRLHSRRSIGLTSINLAVSGLTEEEWQTVRRAVSTLLSDILPSVDIGPTDRGSSSVSTSTADESVASEEDDDDNDDDEGMNYEILLPDNGDIFLL